MKKTIKANFKSSSGEQGFALPLAIGLGLIMLLVGATMIVRSQGDQVTASAQTATSRALGAAEAGITRYQSLINSYRAIALYRSCNGTPGADGVCPDTSPTVSWKTASIVPGIGSNCIGNPTSTVSPQSTTAWQDVDSADAAKGQFRLVSYVYPAPGTGGTPGVAPGTGTLTVQGRVNQVGSGSTATTTGGTATTQVQVNIPVQASSTSRPPGMWIKTSVDTGTVSADIWAPCTGPATASPAPGYSLIRENFTMPDPPPKPTTNIGTIGNISGLALPLATDTNSGTNYNSATGAYQYSVSTITDSFTFRPGYKVDLWLDGAIDLQGGQKAIVHNCTGVSNCSPFDARIYGLATSASGNNTLHLGGNPAICAIFFHAPTYNVDLNGGGQAQGCGGGANNNGIYWVNSWSGGGQGNHNALDQTSAEWSQSPSFKLPPPIAPVATWQRQQAQ